MALYSRAIMMAGKACEAADLSHPPAVYYFLSKAYDSSPDRQRVIQRFQGFAELQLEISGPYYLR